MDSCSDHSNRHTADEAIARAEGAYSSTVERRLGKPSSAKRRIRLDGIRRRLQDEGSPVVIKEAGEAPLVAYLAGGARADRDFLTIFDISELPAPPFEALKAVFGLSAAEARLAQALARGESVESAARLLEIKPTTARTQLAAIFDKTGTHRQAKLVALLSRLAYMNEA
jgi:DNA-binding CsgD family transcriptional regulator